MVQQEGAEEITISEGGSKSVVTELQAVAKTLFAKAMKDDVPAAKLITSAMANGDGGELVDAAEYQLTEADLKVMGSYADWLNILEQAKKGVGSDKGEWLHRSKLRSDLCYYVERAFADLNPGMPLSTATTSARYVISSRESRTARCGGW